MRSSATYFRHRGDRLIAVLNRPTGPEKRRFPAVLLLHGFPGAEKNVDIQRALLARGVASLALHFRGAWGSEGRYAFGDMPDQALAALRFLRARPFVDPARVGLFGFSMGGWAALNAAARDARLKTVVAVAPVGGPEMVTPRTREKLRRLSRVLRVGSLTALHRDFIAAVRGQDPALAAARLRRPLLLVHGTKDDVVSPLVSERIFGAAAEPKRLVRAAGAGHDFLDRRERLTRLTRDWFLRRL